MIQTPTIAAEMRLELRDQGRPSRRDFFVVAALGEAVSFDWGEDDRKISVMPEEVREGNVTFVLQVTEPGLGGEPRLRARPLVRTPLGSAASFMELGSGGLVVGVSLVAWTDDQKWATRRKPSACGLRLSPNAPLSLVTKAVVACSQNEVTLSAGLANRVLPFASRHAHPESIFQQFRKELEASYPVDVRRAGYEGFRVVPLR